MSLSDRIFRLRVGENIWANEYVPLCVPVPVACATAEHLALASGVNVSYSPPIIAAARRPAKAPR